MEIALYIKSQKSMFCCCSWFAVSFWLGQKSIWKEYIKEWQLIRITRRIQTTLSHVIWLLFRDLIEAGLSKQKVSNIFSGRWTATKCKCKEAKNIKTSKSLGLPFHQRTKKILYTPLALLPLPLLLLDLPLSRKEHQHQTGYLICQCVIREGAGRLSEVGVRKSFTRKAKSICEVKSWKRKKR